MFSLEIKDTKRQSSYSVTCHLERFIQWHALKKIRFNMRYSSWREPLEKSVNLVEFVHLPIWEHHGICPVFFFFLYDEFCISNVVFLILTNFFFKLEWFYHEIPYSHFLKTLYMQINVTVQVTLKEFLLTPTLPV